jgi:putative FmdB family regulatory protein
MPTYEYLCQTCSHRFEKWQKMIDDPLTICPECGGHIRRVFFPAGIVFKGSGFYKTDHRTSSNGTNGHATKSENDTAAATTDESKTAGESKPASTESSSSTTTSGNKVPTTAAATKK